MLINAQYHIYGIKILTCDLRTLVKMAANSILNDISVDYANIFKRYGLLID